MRPRREISHEEIEAFMESEYREKLRDLGAVREMPWYRGESKTNWIKPKE